MLIPLPIDAPVRLVNSQEIVALEPDEQPGLYHLRLRYRLHYLLTEEQVRPILRAVEFQFRRFAQCMEEEERDAF